MAALPVFAESFDGEGQKSFPVVLFKTADHALQEVLQCLPKKGPAAKSMLHQEAAVHRKVTKAQACAAARHFLRPLGQSVNILDLDGDVWGM